MSKFVPHSVSPRIRGRRITGSAFRLGGLALAVAPPSRTVLIPRQRCGGVLGKDRRTDTV